MATNVENGSSQYEPYRAALGGPRGGLAWKLANGARFSTSVSRCYLARLRNGWSDQRARFAAVARRRPAEPFRAVELLFVTLVLRVADAALRRLVAAEVRRPAGRFLDVEPMFVSCPRDDEL